MAALKLKGKKLYEGEVVVAGIVGGRYWFQGVPMGGYKFRLAGGFEREGFAYFLDAVVQARLAFEAGLGKGG